MLGLGVLVLGKLLWDLFNKKPDDEITDIVGNGEYVIGPTNASYKIRYTRNRSFTDQAFCNTGNPIDNSVLAPVNAVTQNYTINRIEVYRSSTVNRQVCSGTPTSAGSTVPLYRLRNAAGSVVATENVTDGQALSNSNRRVDTTTWSGFSLQRNSDGLIIPLQQTTPGVFAPGTQPQVSPLPATAPAPAPAPLPFLPAPAPLPATVPDRQPVPAPAPVPGGLPRIAPSIAPSIAPARSPATAPAPAPAQPQPRPVPAVGPLPATAAPLVPVTPSEAVLIDGQLVGGPGQTPAPNLVSIAQEVGRLERKSELLMGRPENGGPGEVAEWAGIRALLDALEEFIRDQLDNVGGGSYLLVAPCPPPGGGEPPPPVEISYGGGTNAAAACLARIDALAALIQAHKDMGQPTCQTPVYGEEVTVHFESP